MKSFSLNEIFSRFDIQILREEEGCLACGGLLFLSRREANPPGGSLSFCALHCLLAPLSALINTREIPQPQYQYVRLYMAVYFTLLYLHIITCSSLIIPFLD
jgi:hypothetical protein